VAWKEGGLVSSKVLHSLLNKIWNEEIIPQDWKLGLLGRLPKKADLSLCKNWRGIMLSSLLQAKFYWTDFRRSKQDVARRDPAVTKLLH